MTIDLNNIFAKSQKYGGTTLIQHSINVAKVVQILTRDVLLKKEIIDEIIVSALLHDIGKVRDEFQQNIKNENEENERTYHNVFSFSAFYKKDIVINGEICHEIPNNILHHHSLITDTFSIGCTDESIYDGFTDKEKEVLSEVIKELLNIAKETFSIDVEIIENKNRDRRRINNYFSVDSNASRLVSENAKLSLYRYYLISSDRIASMMESNGIVINDENVKSIIENKIDYVDDIQLPSNFDSIRFEKQKQVAYECSLHKTSMVTAPAGVGKTIIAGMWHNNLRNNKKTYIVCPTNAIARNEYRSIIEDFKLINLKSTIGLFLTGQYEQGDEKSQIIVTNIDCWLKSSFRGYDLINSYELFNNNVIFDEFHMLISEDAYFSEMLSLICARNRFCNSKTLLLSATPITNISNFWENDKNRTFIQRIDSHISSQRLNISFINENAIDIDTLVSTNSIKLAQVLHLEKNIHKKGHLLHSSFIEKDYIRHLEEILVTYSKYAENKGTSVVASRCLSTGVNISCSKGIEICCSPEYTLQFIGRLGRFGEMMDKTIDVNILKYDSFGLFSRNEIGAIRILYDFDLSKIWYEFLKKETDNKIITIAELYEIYYQFYKDNATRINAFIERKIIDSANRWNDINSINNIGSKFKTKLKSLRNDDSINYFISPLNNNSNNEFIEDYINDRANRSSGWSYNDNELKIILRQLKQRRKYKKDVNRLRKEIEMLLRKSSKDEPFFDTKKRYNSVFGLYDSSETQFNVN